MSLVRFALGEETTDTEVLRDVAYFAMAPVFTGDMELGPNALP
jgi:hypothetical protein